MMVNDGSCRCGRIVLAGKPNAGKSTLLNRLVGQKLAIVSHKPQATRHSTIGVRTDENTQLIFVDPPGLLEPDYLLQEAMLKAALDELRRADAVLHLWAAADGAPVPLADLIGAASPYGGPVLTLLTKADLMPKTAAPSGALRVSAVSGEGIDTVLAWCRGHAPRGSFRCDPDTLSEQPLRFFVAEFVREAAFETLGQELPYSIATVVEEFRESTAPVYIRVTLLVERESQKGMVIGSGGRTIKALGARARPRIENLLGGPVYLDLWVKVLPKWRTNAHKLRRLGFSPPTGRKR